MKFWYLELDWQNFQFLPTFHWKSFILSSAMNMTSLSRPTWDVGTYFGMYGKRSPLAILWYQLHAWGFILKLTGGGNHTLGHVGKLCYKKGLVGWGLKLEPDTIKETKVFGRIKSIAWTLAAFQTKLKSADTYPLSLLSLSFHRDQRSK